MKKPQNSPYYQCVEDNFKTLEQVYDEHFTKQHGFFQPDVIKVIYRYLDCGILHNCFARVKCRISTMSFYWHCSASVAISVPPVIKKGWWNLVSGSAKKSSPSQKPGTSSFTRQLTPSEIESLRQDKKEASAYARLFFEKKLSPKK